MRVADPAWMVFFLMPIRIGRRAQCSIDTCRGQAAISVLLLPWL
jgi:hypothetical protein